MNVESGIHKFVGFYKEYEKFLKRAGLNLDDVFIYQDEIEIRVAEGGDKNSRQASDVAAAGLAYRGSPSADDHRRGLGNSELLSWRDKWQLARFIIAVRCGTFAILCRSIALSIAEYARQHSVSENVIYTVLWTFSSGLFFLSPERYSAYPFFALTWAGIKGSFSSRIAIFRGGMTDVMAAPIADAIVVRGGDVRTGVMAERILFEGGKVTGVAAGEEIYRPRASYLLRRSPPQKRSSQRVSDVPQDAELEKLRILPDMSVLRSN
jgi:15-cis-phytoene desaturase